MTGLLIPTDPRQDSASRIVETMDAIDASARERGILDEISKREIRRATLTAVCVPGYLTPFGSREMPVARGLGVRADCRSRSASPGPTTRSRSSTRVTTTASMPPICGG